MSALLLAATLGLLCGGVLGYRWAQRQPSARHLDTEQAPAALQQLQHQLDIARAAESERKRIYDDLHDDVGSKLLTLLHQVPAAQQAQVREVLQDIRDIVARSRSLGGSLLEVLALLREESERRLDVQGIELDWRQAPDLPDPVLNDAQAMHLFRIGRESVTNALRHAKPRRLRMLTGTAGRELVFEVTDDGAFDADRIGSGRGTRSMQSRANELQGGIAWMPGTQGGTKVRLRFPLPDASTVGVVPPQPRDGQ